MKTNFLVGLSITTLMFAGCSKDEMSSITPRDANSIGFEISTGKTRANVVNIGALQNAVNGFGVFATNGTSSSTFINNKAYIYQGNVWRWSEQDLEWPKEDSGYPVNFYAYYPQSSAKLTASLTANYTVAATPEKQVDLLASNRTGVSVKPASGDVSLSFKHMLSKVDFRVVTGAKVTVEVQSMAVRNVGNTGTFNFAVTEWKTLPNSGNAGYNYMTAQAPKTINKFVGQTAPKNVNGSNGSLMLMPQNLENRGWNKTLAGLVNQSYIEVVYRVYETSTGRDVVGFSDAKDHPNYLDVLSTVTGPLFVKVGYTLPTNWQMGKAYAYIIHIGDGSSGGNLIEENFIDKDGKDTDLPVVDPETGEKIEPPDPIFPDKDIIGFVVSVEEWAEPVVEVPLK